MDRPSDLAVIVLSFNGVTDTVQCLQSLRPSLARVILVDNGSTDGTVDTVHSGFPWVDVVETGENLGFTGGMNVGLKRALDQGFPYICILNNDTQATDRTFSTLLDYCRRSQDVAVSPRIDFADGSGTWFIGAELDVSSGWPVHTRIEAYESGAPLPTGLLSGCCIMASRATWERVGLFDDSYFLNFEDSDWSMRARAAGVDLHVLPDAVLLHGVSRSFKRDAGLSLLGTYYFIRNGLLFRRLYMSSMAGAFRFLRVHVLAAGKRDLKSREVSRALMRALAVGDHLLRRYGRARGWAARLAPTGDKRTEQGQR